MVIVAGVILAVACIMAFCEMRNNTFDERKRGDVPEEVLARQMPGEYPAYKKLFETQSSSLLYMPPFRS